MAHHLNEKTLKLFYDMTFELSNDIEVFKTGHRYLDNCRLTSAKIVSRSWMEHFILYNSLVNRCVLYHTKSYRILYLHYLWYSSRCVDDSRKNIKDLIYCLTLVVANDVNSNLFDINYMVMVIFQFCYSGMYAPTRILLICEVSVHLMKIYFCETN